MSPLQRNRHLSLHFSLCPWVYSPNTTVIQQVIMLRTEYYDSPLSSISPRPTQDIHTLLVPIVAPTVVYPRGTYRELIAEALVLKEST